MQIVRDRADLLVTTADHVDKAALQVFLSRSFGGPKSEFLRRYASWCYRGEQNRLVVVCDGEIAAYCGVIPTSCLLRGKKTSALWWVDLVVAAEFRGRGIQAVLDRQVRHFAGLKVGFPNDLAAGIHIKHGWGVREDLQTLALAINPLGIKRVRMAKGARGWGLRAAAIMATPLARFLSRRLERYQPLTARSETGPSEGLFADLFERFKTPRIATTYRDPEHIRWRYLDCPYRSQLEFYFAGPFSSPTHYVIARNMERDKVKVTRILDVFGDFGDEDGLRDVLRLALRDAVRQGSSQVTTLVSSEQLRAVYRSLGFVLGSRMRFCWYGDPHDDTRGLDEMAHWTLGDSDNDEPTYPFTQFSQQLQGDNAT